MNLKQQRYRLFSHIMWGKKKRDYRNKYLALKSPTQSNTSDVNQSAQRIDKNVLHIAIAEGGGLGDALIQLVYLKEIKKMFRKPVVLDFYCRHYHAFENTPFIDHVFKYSDTHPVHLYDVYIVSRRFYIICKINEKKTRAFSSRFYKFCMKSKHLTDSVLKREYNDNLYSQYALLFGKNRQEQSDVYGYIPVTRYTPSFLSWKEEAFSVLQRLDLKDVPYITFCRAVDAKYGEGHPKLWPLPYYNRLIALIRKHYPKIKLVQVGTPQKAMKGVNLNVTGKTNLEEIKVLLKYSMLHVDGEGGLVHLKHLLQGVSVVLFGPTDPKIFGYDNNVNLTSQACKQPCEWVTPNWTEACLKGKQPAACMQQLFPEKVFDAVKTYIDNLPKFEYKFLKEDKCPRMVGKSVAIIGREISKELGKHLKGTKSITVYNEHGNVRQSIKPHNVDYVKNIWECSYKAEFSTPYNISAPSNTYDYVYISKLDDDKYCTYVVKEALRIVKPAGTVVLPTQNLPPKEIYSIVSFKEPKNFILIKKS